MHYKRLVRGGKRSTLANITLHRSSNSSIDHGGRAGARLATTIAASGKNPAARSTEVKHTVLKSAQSVQYV